MSRTRTPHRPVGPRAVMAALVVLGTTFSTAGFLQRRHRWRPDRVVVGYRTPSWTPASTGARPSGSPGLPRPRAVPCAARRDGPDARHTAARRRVDDATRWRGCDAGTTSPTRSRTTSRTRPARSIPTTAAPRGSITAGSASSGTCCPGRASTRPRRGRTCSPTHRAGGSGVTVAVLDTGVAYRDWGQFKASPDLRQTRFVAPYDFVAHNRYPLDRDGHGTLVVERDRRVDQQPGRSHRPGLRRDDHAAARARRGGRRRGVDDRRGDPLRGQRTARTSST